MQKPAVELLSDERDLSPQELALAELIVTTLNLEKRPAEFDPEAPLYGEGLGLDSIDILEIALAVSKAYGIRLRSDDGNNQKIFSSLRSLSQHIQQFRAK
jgi:acyl carrier protein